MITQADDNLAILIKGRFFRAATLRDEPYECLKEPEPFIAKLKQQGIRADFFIFMQEIADTSPSYPFHREDHQIAALAITSYRIQAQK